MCLFNVCVDFWVFFFFFELMIFSLMADFHFTHYLTSELLFYFIFVLWLQLLELLDVLALLNGWVSLLIADYIELLIEFL